MCVIKIWLWIGFMCAIQLCVHVRSDKRDTMSRWWYQRIYPLPTSASWNDAPTRMPNEAAQFAQLLLRFHRIRRTPYGGVSPSAKLFPVLVEMGNVHCVIWHFIHLIACTCFDFKLLYSRRICYICTYDGHGVSSTDRWGRCALFIN